ncbi:MAG TPA: aldo/keto reductase [Rhodanobacteraceae bacterium]|nr:aldo/keto reductase [Rhodanobacteraceae bacterium]
MLPTRRIADLEVSALGLGCMGLTHAYGTPIGDAQADSLLLGALEAGVTLFDTAALYSFGANEELVGRILAPHRHEFVLASKCGIFRGPDGKRQIDGRPETLKRTCEDSLRRLRTDVIDLYYLHRWDKSVPIEDSVGALADMVRAGKVRHIGLSEVSAATLRRAYAVHPIAALQSEYSLWSRNVEIGALAACRELGVALVAFSPLGRAYLAGAIGSTEALDAGDLRRRLPRFQQSAIDRNAASLRVLRELADGLGCTPAQLALAWLLRRGEDVIPIPGTTTLAHLKENLRALDVRVDDAVRMRLDALFAPGTVEGDRYAPNRLVEIDTETFAAR